MSTPVIALLCGVVVLYVVFKLLYKRYTVEVWEHIDEPANAGFMFLSADSVDIARGNLRQNRITKRWYIRQACLSFDILHSSWKRIDATVAKKLVEKIHARKGARVSLITDSTVLVW